MEWLRRFRGHIAGDVSHDHVRTRARELKRELAHLRATRGEPFKDRARKTAESATNVSASEEGFVEERGSRASFYLEAARFTPLVAVETDEGSFLVPTREMGSLGKRLFATGTYAGDMLPQVLAAAREAGFEPPPGGTVFDIGANIGTVVIPAVTRHGYERGVAFEAHPTTTRILRLNVQYSGVADRIQVVETALGAEDGEASMRAGGAAGRQRILPATAEDPGGTVDVSMARLDTLLESGAVDAGSLTLLWLDVQGFEAAVLRGASSLLVDPPLVVTEFSPRHLGVHGELEPMVALIESTFTHVIDLKSTLKTDRLDLFPAARTRKLVDRLGDRFTDLALLRLPSLAARHSDVP